MSHKHKWILLTFRVEHQLKIYTVKICVARNQHPCLTFASHKYQESLVLAPPRQAALSSATLETV